MEAAVISLRGRIQGNCGCGVAWSSVVMRASEGERLARVGSPFSSPVVLVWLRSVGVVVLKFSKRSCVYG